MAKTITPELKAHYALGSNTISRQWKCTRKDGLVLAVTTCARDLLFDGVIYRSADGFNPKATEQNDTGAVANSEVEGSLSDDITEIEFEAGLWDGATVEVFEVNYRALSQGVLAIATSTLGDIKVSRSAFNAELRGLTQIMQKQTSRRINPTCDWLFGDPRCGIDLSPITVTGTITSAADRRTFIDTSRTEGADYFGAGRVRMDTGLAAGEELEVYSYDSASKTFVMHLPYHANIAVGDAYTAVPGCRRRFTDDCKGKWANGRRFGGFPFVPGPDKILGMGGTEGTAL